jgi:hypothetical protein
LDNKNDGTVTDEVQSRLEDLFGESGKASVFMEDSSVPEDSPLRILKGIVLSVDWEIDDEVMAKLIEEIGRLEHTYKDDKTLLSFFRLLGSVGKYIKTRKADAHPDAIKLLNSTYNSLEKVFLSKGITQAEKKETLLAQVKEFKKLKEQIAFKKADTAKEEEVKPPKETKPVIEKQEKDVVVQAEHTPPEETEEELLLRSEMSRMTPQEALAYVLAELKQVIRAEFKALNAKLKS